MPYSRFRTIYLPVTFFLLISIFLLTSNSYSDSKAVKVGVYQNAPKVFTDEKGETQGFFVDVLKTIANRENWDLEYVPGTWPQCLDRLEKGEIDLLMAIGYSEERTNRFDYNEETVLSNWAILYLQEGSEITSIPELANRKIAVLKGDIYYNEFRTIINRFGIEVKFLEQDDFLSVLKKVDSLEADGGLVNRFFGHSHEDEFAIEPSSIICCPVEIRYAAPKGQNRDLLLAIDRHLISMKKKRPSPYHIAMNRWIDEKHQRAFPAILFWIFLILFSIAIAGIVLSWILKRQVRKGTKKLTERNIELLKEIKNRERAETALRESENRYARAIAGTNDGLFDWDIKNNKVFFSPRWKEIIGYQHDEIDDHFDQWESRVHPDDLPHAMEQINKHLNGEIPKYEVEFRFLHKDGSWRWVLAKGLCVRDENGDPVQMAGSHSDITLRKKAEASLVESEEKYRTIFNSAQVGLFRIDIQKGKILDANKVMAKIFGYDNPEDFIFEFLMEPHWANPQERQKMYQAFQDNNNTLDNYEAEFYRKDGKKILCRFSAELFPEKGYMEGVGQDITEQKEMANSLMNSEAKNRALLNAIPDMMFQLRKDGTFIGYKAALADQLLLPPEAFLGKNIQEVMPPHVSRKTMENVKRALETNEVQIFEYELEMPDGAKRTFEARVVLSTVDEVLTIVRDITQKIRHIDELRESVSKYKTIFETTGTATVIFDENLIITLANSEFVRIAGHSKEEIEGKMSALEFLPDELRKDIEEFRADYPFEKKGNTYQVSMVDREGNNRSGISIVNDIPGTNQKVASFLDLTEQKRAEMQMFRAEKMASLGQIIAGIAHEINNPNNFITFNLPTVKEYISELRPIIDRCLVNEPDLKILNMPVDKWFENMSKLLDNMQHGSSRITSIVSELKTYIRSHEVEEKKAESITSIIDHVMTLIGKQVQKTIRNFNIEIEDGLPPVWGNGGKLEQVFINMIINAGHAADKEDSQVSIRAKRSTKDPNFLEVAIEDNGSGMSPEVLQQIFDPFFTTKGRESGTGLGLAISHKIIEEHGGVIDVSSKIGEGSIFIIQLPIFKGDNK